MRVPRKVLVIRFRRLGDAVLSAAICRSLRRSLPGAEIHYVLNEAIAPLFEGHPDIDQVISFSPREWERPGRFVQKVWRLMRRGRYDALIDTRTTLGTLCFALFAPGMPFRVGTWKWYSWGLHNYRIRNQAESPLDEVRRNLRLLEPLEQVVPVTYVADFRLSLPTGEVSAFREEMRGRGMDFSRPVVVCVPCTRVVGKAWPGERMKAVLERVLATYPGVQLIFNYAGREREEAFALYRAMGQPRQVLIDVEANSPRKLAAMLACATLFFGNEGGARHVAQAVGLPSLAIFPPRVEMQKWLPDPGEGNQGVTPGDGVPIEQWTRMADEERFACLTVEKVWERLQPMLERYCGAARSQDAAPTNANEYTQVMFE